MPKTLTSLIAITLISGITSPAVAQQNSRQPQKIAVTECEGVNNCTTWTFMNTGTQMVGSAKWPDGEESVLQVDKATNSEITITRTDITGAKQGLSATYKGTIHGKNVGGEFTSSYNGQADSGNWYWVFDSPSSTSLPVEFHFCGQGCFSLHLINGVYKTTDGQGTWKVEPFDGKTLKLDRQDPSGFVGYYKGDLLNGRVVNITTGSRPFTPDWKPGPDTRYNNVLMTYGPELNSIPGDGGVSPLRGARRPLRDLLLPSRCNFFTTAQLS